MRYAAPDADRSRPSGSYGDEAEVDGRLYDHENRDRLTARLLAVSDGAPVSEQYTEPWEN